MDLGGGGFLRRVGDLPGRVVGRGGVGVQGVQGEAGAGVPEVVLLPPPEVSRQQTSPAARSAREVSAWMMERLGDHGWRTSSYSANGGTECVEVGLDHEAESVVVRDTKARSGPVWWFSPGPGAPSPIG